MGDNKNKNADDELVIHVNLQLKGEKARAFQQFQRSQGLEENKSSANMILVTHSLRRLGFLPSEGGETATASS